ncbi:MAG: 2-C-methyl-D-erythritol 4-phosphate cytidylyltransferase [Chthoniobacterales bacterium]
MALPSVCAVIVAAGSSQRMGFDKLTAPVAGKPLLAHTLAAFQACPEVQRIVLVCAAERISEFETLATKEGISKLEKIVAGGSERHESVWHGLQATSPEYEIIAVQDAARPLITAAQITLCIEAAAVHGAASLAEPVTDTLQRADAFQRIAENVDRRRLWRMQTPQVFRRELLLEAYRKVLEGDEIITDETTAVQSAGHDVFLVENRDWNIKVTTPRDLAVVEFLLKERVSST